MGALHVMKEVGYAWQGLSANDKQYFQDKADRDKIRYLKEQRIYYDEVERVGNLIGTKKLKDGRVNIATKLLDPSINSSKRQAKVI